MNMTPVAYIGNSLITTTEAAELFAKNSGKKITFLKQKIGNLVQFRLGKSNTLFECHYDDRGREYHIHTM